MKMSIKHSVDRTVCTLPLSAGGGLNLLPNFQKVAGGLTRSQFSEGVAGKEGATLFRGRRGEGGGAVCT